LYALGDTVDDLSDLTPREKAALDDWAAFFVKKYDVVGYLVAR
jgi:hypothetical protein